ncbi:hypothetical protein E2P81_ATG07303 [Venturia nashicola]|uniref:U4/U6.U5 small nuclear ribonucleoprotein 27kDa protein domain-containing protein n=1 Tax=Venturia nashicola TaxID=86259 RepID=A0A4Z1P1G3_9PEZI|nr:hypothetical protein E6O75_ATG07463 [Venturia nashicola]TLD31813.1 hypothetical protein E2P81_ATG07303 [Venturia nashicola]
MSQRDSRGGPRAGGGRGRGRGGGDRHRDDRDRRDDRGADRNDRRERDNDRRGGEEPTPQHSPLARRTKTHQHVAGDSRARSRSPRRDNTRDTRTRSPPRRPRRGNDREDDRQLRNPTKPELARPAASSTRPPIQTEVKKEPAPEKMEIVKEEDEDSDEAEMRVIMGFGKFKSTKNTKVPGNDQNYAVRKEKKTEYRQYMNRTGGFNRPLSPG